MLLWRKPFRFGKMKKRQNHKSGQRGLLLRIKRVLKDRRVLQMLLKLRQGQGLKEDFAGVTQEQTNNKKTKSRHSSTKGEGTTPISNRWWVWKISKISFRNIRSNWGQKIYSKYCMQFWDKCFWLKSTQLIIWCLIWRRSFPIIITLSMIITLILPKIKKTARTSQRCQDHTIQNEILVQPIRQGETRNRDL